MLATIIIAESFTRIMGSTAGNVYSTIVAVVSCSITLWILVGGGQNFLPPPPPPLAAALYRARLLRRRDRLPHGGNASKVLIVGPHQRFFKDQFITAQSSNSMASAERKPITGAQGVEPPVGDQRGKAALKLNACLFLRV